jgi:hypothetical protein
MAVEQLARVWAVKSVNTEEVTRIATTMLKDLPTQNGEKLKTN